MEVKTKKPTATKIRSFRVYSYIPEEMGDWATKKSKQYKLTFASYIYAVIKHVHKTDKNFDPREYLKK